jgi:hypothetical protein
VEPEHVLMVGGSILAVLFVVVELRSRSPSSR